MAILHLINVTPLKRWLFQEPQNVCLGSNNCFILPTISFPPNSPWSFQKQPGQLGSRLERNEAWPERNWAKICNNHFKKFLSQLDENRPFLIIQRSEGLPTSDAAQVRHWYVFCVLLYPFWMRVLCKAPARPHLWGYKSLRTVESQRSAESLGKLIALRK